MSRQHLLQLTRKHQDLDAKIFKETRSPSSDDLALAALKRQNLKLKEQIAFLSHEVGEGDRAPKPAQAG